jgi:hypothetical protein
MGDGGAQRSALTLSSCELVRQRVLTIAEANSVQKSAHPRPANAGGFLPTEGERDLHGFGY